MSSDYGDLSRIALNTELDVGQLRARLAYMCSAWANLEGPPREPFVLQLTAARGRVAAQAHIPPSQIEL
jgi:hypothetical protein